MAVRPSIPIASLKLRQMPTSTIPAISFQNDLAYDITVYDSFVPSPLTDADKTYFGQLTMLGNVAAKSTGSITPIHPTSAFIIDNSTNKKPVKRCTKMEFQTTLTSFTVAQADEDAMTATFKFIDFFLHQPGDPAIQSFKAILAGDSKKWLSDMNAFFVKQPAYSLCTFQTYMMAIAYTAMNPESAAKPPAEATYSLSGLVTLMGGKWPDGMPDITVSHFTCNTQNGVVDIWFQIDISCLPFETDAIAKNFNSLYFDKKVQANLQFNYGFGLGILGTRLAVYLDTIKIPISSSDQFGIMHPTLTVDINPLFRFVVLTISGMIPFSVFNKSFNVAVSFTIDNVEAHVGAVIQDPDHSLPTPPFMKGVHFDEFGIGMGIFFEPPGFALGLQGKLHIGEPAAGTLVDLADDTFALICKMDGEVPEPVYASFYVPRMDINSVVEVFTNSSPNISIPITFTDLSFRWAENPMEPYVLPDGTLTDMAYGFSAAVDIFSFGFYGDVEIDMTNGLTATVEMSPLSLGPVFKLSGDGKGVTIKVDADGNPIKNNQIRDKKVLQDALAKATDKQLVAPGGPVLLINTFTSPLLHVNGKVSLFEIIERAVEIDIDRDGIKFELDFGGILTEQMTCTLQDFHNFAGVFKFGIDHTFTLPTVLGVPLGSIHVQAMAQSYIEVWTSLTDVNISVGGSFEFEGHTLSFGNFSVDIHISRIIDVIEAIVSYLTDNVEQIFTDIIHDAEQWAQKAKQGLITGYDTVSHVLKNGFNKLAGEVASIMKGAGYTASEVGLELPVTFGLNAAETAQTLSAAGYPGNEIIAGLK